MDIHSMSIVELKQLARDHRPRIKQYYTKKRIDLIRLLSMKELPESFVIEKLTIHELRKQAVEKSIPKLWTLKRDELVELLYPSFHQNNQNNESTEKHDYPNKSDS